jgi:hypothetical protein
VYRWIISRQPLLLLQQRRLHLHSRRQILKFIPALIELRDKFLGRCGLHACRRLGHRQMPLHRDQPAPAQQERQPKDRAQSATAQLHRCPAFFIALR